jgi:hypothetical protein
MGRELGMADREGDDQLPVGRVDQQQGRCRAGRRGAGSVEAASVLGVEGGVGDGAAHRDPGVHGDRPLDGREGMGDRGLPLTVCP